MKQIATTCNGTTECPERGRSGNHASPLLPTKFGASALLVLKVRNTKQERSQRTRPQLRNTTKRRSQGTRTQLGNTKQAA